MIMKRNFKAFILSAAVTVGLFGTYSCVDPEDLMTDSAKEGGLVFPTSTSLSFIGNPISVSVETTEGITEVSFYKSYVKDDVVSVEVFDQTVAVSGDQVEFTSDYAALKNGLPGMPADAADLEVGDYWIFRIVSTLDDGRKVQNGQQIRIVVDNPFSGNYHTTGSVNRETSPGVFSVTTYEDDKALTTIGSATCETLAAFGFFGNATLLFYLTVNPDNTVTISPSENPDAAVEITGTPGKVSTYDPTTKTFMLYYEYKNASNLKREMTEKVVRK